jgi:hypothetical protein
VGLRDRPAPGDNGVVMEGLDRRLRFGVGAGVAMFLALVLASACPGAEDPLDLSKTLVGTWRGRVEVTIQGGSTSPARTLVIKSVRWNEGRWQIDADYGVTGGGLHPIDGTLDVVGEAVKLEFVNWQGAWVRLTLVRRERALVGGTQRRGGGNPIDIRLLKVAE